MTDRRAFRWGRTVWPAVVAVLLAGTSAAAAIFTDIQGLPMQRAIERLAAKGIFRGTSGTTFNPGGTVSRSDFAVLLVRTLGLDTQGVSLPAFKDAAEVARDQAPAVAAVTSLGSVSPQRVEVKRGALVYTLGTDKPVYSPADQLTITFAVRNTSEQVVRFDHVNSQMYDFIIRGTDGREVAKWSLGRPFLPLEQPVSLAGGQTFTWQTRWKQLDQSDEPVAPGRYEIVAIHTTKADPASLSLFFNKGVMTPYPDNTFRPKEEITRLDLATIAARAIGLSDARALEASDAAAVPATSRGTVAAAVERRLISLIGREFRPGQKATRAEVAQALDGLMDAVKRYNFSKGTLKDPVSGNPPQITIEDDRKALRTYRVARNVAVYRNDRVAELRDLRAGDAILFLNVGDVGDVAYIEATGR